MTTSIDKSQVGKRLLEIRGNRKRKDVADALGISVSTLAMYETGKRIPRDEFKLKIAEYYKTDVGKLFFAS